MESAASGIIEALQAEFFGEDTDWDKINPYMYNYGSGGISCWGTLCGIPNGCVALLNLLGVHGTLGSQVLGYYSSTEFPTSSVPDLYGHWYYGSGGGNYVWPKQPVPDDEVLAHVTSYSPLCHVSISRWCFAAGVDLNDATGYGTSHKNDRCGKMCADVTGFTAELINYYATTAGVERPYVLPAKTGYCKECHWSVDNNGDPPAQCGQMDCEVCHTPNIGRHHAWGDGRIVIDDLWTEDGVGGVKTSFTEGDTIVYKVKFYVLGIGSSWVKAVRSKAKDSAGTAMIKFVKDEDVAIGPHEWSWSDTIESGDAVGKASAKVKLKMYDYKGGSYISLVKHDIEFDIV